MRVPIISSKILPIRLSNRTITGLTTLALNILFSRVFNRPSTRGPTFVTWLPTFDCNAYCVFCGTHILHKKTPEALSGERALQIAEEIVQAKTWVVGFTGGEVLLWPHLFDVIRILKRHGVFVYIVTNGLLLEQFAEEIISSGVDTVVISIDSNEASEHDQIRKVEGLYQKAIDGIEKMKSLRVGRKPRIKSTTVVFKANIERLEQIIGHLQGIVDETSIQPIVGDYEDHPHNRGEGRLTKFMFGSEHSQLVEQTLGRFFRRFPSYKKYYFQMIPTYWKDPQYLADTIKCWSPFLRLQIMPNGTTRQCTVRSDYGATGNLNQCSLMDAWNSIEMRRQREEIRHHCNNCICWTQDTAFNATLHGSRLANLLPVISNRRLEKKFGISNRKLT